MAVHAFATSSPGAAAGALAQGAVLMTGRLKPSAPRVAALRERRAALGLVRVEVWVRPNDAERVRAFAASLLLPSAESPEPAAPRRSARRPS